jgi:hypothetical protein
MKNNNVNGNSVKPFRLLDSKPERYLEFNRKILYLVLAVGAGGIVFATIIGWNN